MSNHVNVFSQRGCIGCKNCEGGGGKMARSALLWTIGILTVGIGLIFLAFFKKCQYCGHNTWLNKHDGIDPRHQHAPAAPYGTEQTGAIQ